MYYIGLLVLFVAGCSTADVVLDDLQGGYQFHAGTTDACTNTFNISSNGPVVDHTQLTFGGEPCTFGKIRWTILSSDHSYWGWNEETIAKAGPILRGDLGVGLTCGGELFTFAHLVRPRADLTLYLPSKTGSSTAVNYEHEVLHLTLWSEDGGCTFRKAQSTSRTFSDASNQPKDVSPGTSTTKQENGSTVSSGSKPESENSATARPPVSSSTKPEGENPATTGATLEKKNPTESAESLWVWLGPVLGAVATVIAAFITVFCVRNYKK